MFPKRHFLALCLLSTASLFFSGCAVDRMALPKFNTAFGAGQYQEALTLARKRTGEGYEKQGALLWYLQRGATERILGDFEGSNKSFDACENTFKHYDLENSAVSVGKTGATLLANDSLRAYMGEQHDRVLTNTYKGLNFAALGDWENARVEFNRAVQRQTIAKEKFAKEIAREQEENKKKGGAGLAKNMNNPKMKSALAKEYSNLENFRAYPDFVNPFTTYVSGLYFLLRNDSGKAVDILKESHGMMPENPIIEEDFASASKRQTPTGEVWVIFENGLGAMRKEIRIDLPLILVTSKVAYTGIALPRIIERPAAYSYLDVSSGTETVRTVLLADMDAVIKAEFKKKFPAILSRAIASALAKAAIQYVAQDRGGLAGCLIAGAYAAATTAADIRIWTALPKNYQVAKVPIPADGNLKVCPPGGTEFMVPIPKCENAIVCIRIPRANVAPAFQVIGFN